MAEPEGLVKRGDLVAGLTPGPPAAATSRPACAPAAAGSADGFDDDLTKRAADLAEEGLRRPRDH